MGFGSIVRGFGAASLCGVLLVGAIQTPAPADAAQVTIPEDCTVVDDLGRSLHGMFTDSSQVGCFELPITTKTAVVVTQPVVGSAAVPVDVTVVDAGGRVMCDYAKVDGNVCGLTGVAPFRLVVSPSTVGSAGDYQVDVQPVTGDTGCTEQVPPGTVGSDTGVDAVMSAEDFAACYSIPADGHSTTELLTAARTAGDGNAKVAVYNQITGSRACSSRVPSAKTGHVIWCNLVASIAYTVVVWGQAESATFRLALRDIRPESLACQPLSGTDIGGPATTGIIDRADDVRCYDLEIPAGDGDLVNVRSTGAQVEMVWVTPDNGYYCQASVNPCTTDDAATDRHYRIVVWSGTAEPIPYRLDAWTVVTSGGVSPLCERLPSVAYGSDSFDVELSDQQTAKCVVAPVGIDDRYRLAITSTDSTAYLFGGLTPNSMSYASPCPATGCYASTLTPRGQSSDGLFFFTPGEQSGDVSYQAQINCLTQPCGGQPYAISQVSPNRLTAGASVTLTVTGSAFDAADTAQLLQDRSAPIGGTVRAVSPDRHTITVDTTLTANAAGYWNLTLTSAKTAQTAAYGAVLVTGPTLKAVAAPSINGTVRVGATVMAAAGSWSPAATGYAYQWFSNGVAIKGATKSTYAIPASLRGHKLTVTVTAKLAFHSDGKATSAAKVVATGAAPKATKPPRVTGTVRVGKTVHLSAGTWSPAATSYSYQWRLNGKAIKGATKSSLRITSSMRGKKLTVTVTAHKTGYYDANATSASQKVK